MQSCFTPFLVLRCGPEKHSSLHQHQSHSHFTDWFAVNRWECTVIFKLLSLLLAIHQIQSFVIFLLGGSSELKILLGLWCKLSEINYLRCFSWHLLASLVLVKQPSVFFSDMTSNKVSLGWQANLPKKSASTRLHSRDQKLVNDSTN